MGCQLCNLFLFRHRRSACHAGDDDRLGNVRQGVFGVECRGSRTEGADAGNILIRDVQRIQLIHLLADGAVQARVAGVQAHDARLFPMRLLDDLQHLLQGHLGAVVEAAVRSCFL